MSTRPSPVDGRASSAPSPLTILVLVATAALASGCGERVFVCTSNAECDLPGRPGFCQPSHQCSHADSSCSSGQRYGTYATDALRDQCVQSDLVTGLHARWGLDEGAGVITKDQSGRGHDGMLSNQPLWVAGRWGSALEFNGTGARVLADETTMRFGSGSFSGFAWVRSDDVDSVQSRIVGRSYVPGGYLFLSFGNGTPFVEARDSAGTYWSTNAKDVNIADGAWHHTGFVCDRDQGSLTVYIDGIASGIKTGVVSTGAFGDEGSTGPAFIGSQTDQPALSLRGTIDEVWLFERALDEAAVRQLYDGPDVNPR